MAGWDEDGEGDHFCRPANRRPISAQGEGGQDGGASVMDELVQDIHEGDQTASRALVRLRACRARSMGVTSARRHPPCAGGIVGFKDSSSAGTTLAIGTAPEFYICRQTVAFDRHGIYRPRRCRLWRAPRITYEVVDVVAGGFLHLQVQARPLNRDARGPVPRPRRIPSPGRPVG